MPYYGFLQFSGHGKAATDNLKLLCTEERLKQMDISHSGGWNEQAEQKSQQSPRGLSRLLLLGLVDVGAAFAQVEVHLVSGVAALQLQQSRVLALVPQAALVAGEDGLTPQSATQTHTQSGDVHNTHSSDNFFSSEKSRWDLLTFQASSIFSRSVHLHTHRERH